MTGDAYADVTARMQTRIDMITGALAELQRQAADTRPDSDDRDAERARAARSGELGPHWRAVQQRIDLGQTTLADVMSGADDSTAARALRTSTRQGLDAAVERERDLAAEEERESVFDEAAALQGRIASRSADVRRLLQERGLA
ncbi:hypothetical protein [Leifsonia sp. Leaf264]|uniref:hypothetical protein n=1 Tax=Leifsonia sp. Leaf264 TaxID=1736314 RepID=UPI0006F5A257|nr:hypothetical protein [Leifsonia sp. Leaf264]KQO95843.1 hypothetical protein ASF30_19865 [Leifsonia sp. Leaf264]